MKPVLAMSTSSLPKIVAGLAAALAVQAFASDVDPYAPNYADRMLSPVAGAGIAPYLTSSRTRFPIRVAVVDDAYCDDRRCDLVREACAKWQAALAKASGAQMTFVFARSADPKGADVVVQFVPGEQIKGFGGFTLEFGAWAWMRLAITDKHGEAVPDWLTRRIATHELGHALGIWGHSPDPHDIMSTNEDAQEITPADVNTLRLAYRGG